MTKIAIVQAPPVLLDKAATLERAVEWVDRAAAHGADLVVFPETYIPGYPEWIWRTRADDHALAAQLQALLVPAAVDLSADDLAPLRRAARERSVTVVCGIQERDGDYSRTTLYNSMVTIGNLGTVLNRHRKLVPTNPERMLWAMGDGHGLRVVPTPSGRLGGLICWENYMPLARFALYAEGVEIYLAPTWDQGEAWLATMCHIARESRAWVVGTAICMQAKDIPDSFPSRAALYPDPEEWLNSGDSVVVDPGGKIVAGPLKRERGVLYADIDLARVATARRAMDVAGHYGRPDVFTLEVDRAARVPMRVREGS